MTLPRLRMNDLYGLTPEECEAKIQEFLDAGSHLTRTEALSLIDAKIDRIEDKFGLTSGEMKHQLNHGLLIESPPIYCWLMLLKVRERMYERW